MAILDEKHRMVGSVPKSVQAYIDSEMDSVRGMSGPFSLEVVSGLMSIQSQAGLVGGALEIGVFEGRFLIGLALALHEGEQALGVDTFQWPDVGVLDRASANLKRMSVSHLVRLRRLDMRNAVAKDLLLPAASRPRVVHVDADHTHESLERDLLLAFKVVDPKGVIVIDDMLHPGYPELYDAVRAAQARHPGWSIFCIIDREDIVASSKFMLADVRMGNFYSQHLQHRFPQYVWKMGASFRNFRALVLAKNPKLATVK
jgi:predicted O-methyltransferase YrrM